MKVLEQKNEEHQIILKVELEPTDVASALNKAYQHVVQEVNIPGFRKGKAPRAIVEQRVGKEALFDEAMEHFLPDACNSLIKENNIAVFGRPQVYITQREPVIFEATIPQPPEIKLGDYNTIKIKPEEVIVKEEEVDKVLGKMRQQSSTFEPVDRALAMGDTAVMDITSTAEGQEFINDKNISFIMQPGIKFPVPGFNEAMEGAGKGEDREFTLKQVDDYYDKTFAGKDIQFHVNLTEVKEERLPELNDDFVKKLGQGFETLDALTDRIRTDFRRREEDRVKATFEDKIVDALVDISQIDFPPSLVEHEIDRMVRSYVDRVSKSVRSEEEFNSIMGQTDEKKLHENYRPQAVQNIKRSLVLSKIAEKEKLGVVETEIDEQIAKFTATGEKQEERRKEISQPDSRAAIRNWLTMRKAIDFLAQKAQAE
jgi:trigger factor